MSDGAGAGVDGAGGGAGGVGGVGGGGRLIVVGTPIGNLDDFSPRGVKALAAADVIFCEDTRRARKLLSAMGIPAPRLTRLDQHNEAATADQVIGVAGRGATAVLVSDAGMPTISDPGYRVVHAVAGDGITVEVVPFPTAVATALAVSGLPASQYRFAGFLARKGRERADQLASIAPDPVTTVIYESPNRVARTVSDLSIACGPERQVVLARELTKLHEEVWRGTLAEALDWVAALGEPRGEWVLILAGMPPDAPRAAVSDGAIADELRTRLAEGADRRQAVAETSAALGIPKREAYRVAVELRRGD